MGTRLDGVKTLITGAKPRVSSEDWKSRRTKAEKELVNHYEGIIEDLNRHNKSMLSVAEKESGMLRALIAEVRSLEESGYEVMKPPTLSNLELGDGSYASIIQAWVMEKAEKSYGKSFMGKRILGGLEAFFSKEETKMEIDNIINSLIQKHASPERITQFIEGIVSQKGNVKADVILGDIKKEWASP